MRFHIEWQDAPGVKDVTLAATWARLEIRIGDSVVTELVDSKSGSHRTGVFGSVFPLAEWVVENWWFLLNEPCRVAPVPCGRQAKPWMADWSHRHCLLSAREGGSLPDLTVFRDEELAIALWGPDPEWGLVSPVRFIGQGQAGIPLDDVRRALIGLVQSTIDRLDNRSVVGPDVDRLLASWNAIAASEQTENDLCHSLAVLGVDPYDPGPDSNEILEIIAKITSSLPLLLREDLLAGTRPPDLRSNAAWVESVRRSLASNGSMSGLDSMFPGSLVDERAFETGYNFARVARQKLSGLTPSEPIADLDSAVRSFVPWPLSVSVCQPQLRDTGLDALVGNSGDGAAVLLVPSSRSETANRFRLARGLFCVLSRAIESSPRLLTPAATRLQRASRAFAAEFLLPAEALRDRVGGLVRQEEVDEVAAEYEVNTLVVRYQIDNHGLGVLES